METVTNIAKEYRDTDDNIEFAETDNDDDKILMKMKMFNNKHIIKL